MNADDIEGRREEKGKFCLLHQLSFVERAGHHQPHRGAQPILVQYADQR